MTAIVPTEVKRARGTYRPDRDAAAVAGREPALIEPVVSAPKGSSLTEFDRMLEQGVMWIGQTDRPMVALAREAMQDYQLIRDDDLSRPRDVFEARKGVMAILVELGFSPSARARLGLAEVKTESKLDELRRRRDDRKTS